MSPVRASAAGATRVCPHCRQTILESATTCPACKHHLRFVAGQKPEAPVSTSVLKVEGAVEHPREGDAWEYSILVTVLDESGAEISRHIAGVGVMRASERRAFTLDVAVFERGRG